MNTIKTKKAVIALLSSYVQMKSGNLREGFKILHAELEENTEGVDTVMDGLAQSVENMDEDAEIESEVEEDDYEFIEDEVEAGCKSKSKVTSRRRLLAGDDMEDEDEEVVDEDEDEDEGEPVEVSEAVARVLSLEY